MYYYIFPQHLNINFQGWLFYLKNRILIIFICFYSFEFLQIKISTLLSDNNLPTSSRASFIFTIFNRVQTELYF